MLIHKREGTHGFTIVELLIVVVVIAILAAITMVTYGGIQARASDAVVQNDFQQISQQLNIFYTDNGVYPSGYNLSSGSPRLTFAKSSYLVTDNAVLYCRNTDGSRMALIGKSKSGTTYYITESITTARIFGYTFPVGVATSCPNAGISDYTGLWIHTIASGWVSWVNS